MASYTNDRHLHYIKRRLVYIIAWLAFWMLISSAGSDRGSNTDLGLFEFILGILMLFVIFGPPIHWARKIWTSVKVMEE
jgi:hypothetical protein